MVDVIEDFDEFSFPKPHAILKKRNPDFFIKELALQREKLDYFKYDDADMNDFREGYEQFKLDADKFLACLQEITLDIVEAMEYYKGVKDYTKQLQQIIKQYKSTIAQYQCDLMDKGIDALDPLATVRQIEEQVEGKANDLLRRKENLDNVEQEIAISEEILAKRKSEMELALQSRYTLTEKQKITLLAEKDMILDGIEQWGSISGAIKHNSNITSKPSTIAMYCTKFPEFGEAINVSKALFKDRVDGLLIERAIEGTENPVFGKGEFIGDYKIKNDKLLLELAKSKIPEEYNKKSVETVKNQQINNMNIISFANVDETKEGFTRDVGVVLDVDDTGKVKRIMQEEKMKEFYSKKPGAQIILPDEEGDDDGEN